MYIHIYIIYIYIYIHTFTQTYTRTCVCVRLNSCIGFMCVYVYVSAVSLFRCLYGSLPLSLSPSLSLSLSLSLLLPQYRLPPTPNNPPLFGLQMAGGLGIGANSGGRCKTLTCPAGAAIVTNELLGCWRRAVPYQPPCRALFCERTPIL